MRLGRWHVLNARSLAAAERAAVLAAERRAAQLMRAYADNEPALRAAFAARHRLRTTDLFMAEGSLDGERRAIKAFLDSVGSARGETQRIADTGVSVLSERDSRRD